MPEQPKSLYARLGGYDAIAAVVDDLLPRLREDSLLGRFWTSPRSVDTNNRERQLAIDFIVSAASGRTIYLGRKLAHKGMGISKADYTAFMRCLSLRDCLKSLFLQLSTTTDRFRIRHRPFGLGRGNGSSCPKADYV